MGCIGRPSIGLTHKDNRPAARQSEFLELLGTVADRNVAGIRDVPEKPDELFGPTHVDNSQVFSAVEAYLKGFRFNQDAICEYMT